MLQQLHGYHLRSRHLGFAFVAVIPLWLTYIVGIRANPAGSMSGLDLATVPIVETWGWTGHLVAHLSVAAILGTIAAVAWRRAHPCTFRAATKSGFGVVVESFIYAAVLGGLIMAILDEVQLVAIGLTVTPASQPGVWDAAVLSAGAGFYEELLFRLLMIAPLAVVFDKLLAMPRPIALGSAIVVGSLLFAGAHHAVLGSEPFSDYAFGYRTVAGLVFGTLLIIRGFAVCTWTHAAYDFLVLTQLS